MIDKLKVKGKVRIEINHANGTKEIIKNNNLVVDLGLNAIVEAIKGTASQEIQDIEFGTSATAATITDTTITGAFSKAVTSISISNYGQATVTASLDTTENNGMTIREMGLKTASGDLFSRVVIPAIVKTNLISVSVIWDIYII